MLLPEQQKTRRPVREAGFLYLAVTNAAAQWT